MAEVRVYGRVDDQIRRQAVFEIDAGLRVDFLPLSLERRQCRDNLDILSVFDVSRKGEGNALDEHAADASRPGRPGDELAFPRNRPLHDKSPGHDVFDGESQAFEGDGRFDDIPLLVDFSLRKENGVPFQFGRLRSPFILVNSVDLNADGVEAEQKSPPLFMICIDINVNRVVRQRLVSVRHGYFDLIGLGIKAPDCQKQIFFVVPQIDYRFLGGLGLFLWLILKKPFYFEGFLFPDILLKFSIDLRGTGKKRNARRRFLRKSRETEDDC